MNLQLKIIQIWERIWKGEVETFQYNQKKRMEKQFYNIDKNLKNILCDGTKIILIFVLGLLIGVILCSIS